MIKHSLLRQWRPQIWVPAFNLSARFIYQPSRVPRTEPRALARAHIGLHPRPLQLKQQQYTRSLFTSSLASLTSSIPPVLIPPVIFLSLLLGLWTWKCLWIIILQDKLLYLSWLPPLSRSEEIQDYQRKFRGVTWTEKQIHSLDGTRLAVCEGRFPAPPGNRSAVDASVQGRSQTKKKRRVAICYFQGNGGSTPLRLPLLSHVMKSLQDSGNGSGDETEYILLALSYRGYWKSSGRATQKGIQKDALAFLSWVHSEYTQPDQDLRIVLWGHSLGAAVASSALAHLQTQPSILEREGQIRMNISGLILEAPISSIKDMLISLYPQKWLPYRYLWPFSWNNWDVGDSLSRLAKTKNTQSPSSSSSTPSSSKDAFLVQRKNTPILLLAPVADEVVPLWVADQIQDKGRSLGLDIQRVDVKGAMHIEAPLKLEGRTALISFINERTGE